MSTYENIISLGFFCGVAQETERLGLRKVSSPFDWVISTSFEKVVELIDNDFLGYINSDMHYYDMFSNRVDNDRYCIQFFHDFNRLSTINEQLEVVKKKYERRIDRFYSDIRKPTIFIRYVYNRDELNWIKTNCDYINNVIYKFNSLNTLVLVGHLVVEEDLVFSYYYVNVDENDVVARKCLSKAPFLKKTLINSNTYSRKKRFFNKLFYCKSCFLKFIYKFRDKYKQIRDQCIK